MNILIAKTVKQTKRLIVAVIGFTILLIGLAMIVLPGPAFVVIPIGLGILATEFLWAKRLLENVRNRIVTYNNKRKNNASASHMKE